MRQIKLRAWLRKHAIIINVYVLDQTGNAGTGTHFEKSKGYSELGGENGGQFVFNIDDAILLEFTGKQDINKNDIYEGHIIKLSADSYSEKLGKADKSWTVYVHYSEAKACFLMSTNDNALTWKFDDTDFNGQPFKREILGNIYQNSDLLK